MAGNTAPIYTSVPNDAWASIVNTANTAMDGTGSVSAIFTAGSNGSFLQRIRLKALGTNGATVIRVFLNNGSTNGTAANNTLIAELSLPSTTASNSASLPDFEIPMNLVMKASYVINVCFGTAATAGYACTGIGGDY